VFPLHPVTEEGNAGHDGGRPRCGEATSHRLVLCSKKSARRHRQDDAADGAGRGSPWNFHDRLAEPALARCEPVADKPGFGDQLNRQGAKIAKAPVTQTRHPGQVLADLSWRLGVLAVHFAAKPGLAADPFAGGRCRVG
jgi:hypothetical protein